MRLLLVATAVLGLAACGSTRSSAPKPPNAPFAKEALMTAGGLPVVGSLDGPLGLTVDYIANQPFEVGFALENESRSPIVVTGIRAVEPSGTLVRQVGTVMSIWDPPKCPPGAHCPFHGFPIQPSAATTERSINVGPGQKLGVGIDFRFARCSTLHTGSRAAPSRVEVSFSTSGSSVRTQTLPLGGSRPLVRLPKVGCGVRE